MAVEFIGKSIYLYLVAVAAKLFHLYHISFKSNLRRGTISEHCANSQVCVVGLHTCFPFCYTSFAADVCRTDSPSFGFILRLTV